ncbi:CRISPR-associated protein Cas4 [Runella slithyformis]|uniref:CRISPR-associated exonuclease Cas4 n=1 Tax=Runella slithyformis (strain ATCC 29530 / DSM 19594 / LMG 11500 / NCIMB 11436 / LSU 4) TaxID=761193 RepID=A0A7U3ZQ27_RUNSL|nr:CRISPR-associated protein Cas4 [Runella slithyformis]AEI51290.1 CRISPR-associated protein Cas4 [Runella slithyformis DSM 19594]
MNINATLVNYYFLCHRKLWLHAHTIRMEHTSEIVYEGKLIGEESYPQRAEKNQEVEISIPYPPLGADGALTAKIDFFDAKKGIVHETKKSNAKEKAHTAQVQFYLYLLRKNGIAVSYGLIEYPKLRLTERVTLDEEEEKQVEGWVNEIAELLAQAHCPARLPVSKCRSCSYFDFCWIDEP